jgi:peptide deformylase
VAEPGNTPAADGVVDGLDEVAEVDPLEGVEPIPLRFFGDQVLRRVANPAADVSDELIELGRRMLVTMDREAGVGLAGPQVGAGVRIFTHALPEQAPPVLINPEIVESRGEWTYQEGCLSIPGLYYDIVRPKEVHVRAIDLHGDEVDFDAYELLARVIQHEIDHLDGVLFVDLLQGDDRRAAELELRSRVAGSLGASDPFLTGKPVRSLLRRRRTARPLS